MGYEPGGSHEVLTTVLAWNTSTRLLYPDTKPLVMDQEFKKLKKLASFMKKEGILTYKTAEIELQLSPAAVFHEPEPKTPIPEQSQPEADPPELVQAAADLGLTPDDYKSLMWSRPGI